MDVVLLGHGDVGKSTYLSSMYHAMQRGHRDFTLRAMQERDHHCLMQQAEKVVRGCYPSRTDHWIAYETVLCHQGKAVMPIRWRDHRGEALGESSSSVETAALLEALASAHGLLVFVDAPGLLDSAGGNGHKVRDLTVHLTRALSQLGNQMLPLTLIISKMDLVSVGQEERSQLLAPFQSLLDALAQAPNIHVTVVEVACGSRPVGVLRPALWTLYFGLIQRGHQLAGWADYYLCAAQSAVVQDPLRSQRQTLQEWSRVTHLLGHAVHLVQPVEN